MDDAYPRREPGLAPVGAPSSWSDLRGWIAEIERQGELLRITAPVDPEEEVGAITFMGTQPGRSPAMLFENLKGNRSDARILTNMLGESKERYAIAVGLDAGLSTLGLIEATRRVMQRRLKPRLVAPEAAPVNEIVLTGDDIDLTLLPVPKFWPGDGGRYLGTGDITYTRDPVTGRINAGVYRQMLQGRNRVGLYCSPGKHGRLDREAYWAKGQPCEVVAAYGIDPVTFIVGSLAFDHGESELDIAGGIMGRPVELTKGVAVDLPIPAQAEIVIEGLLYPDDLAEEGPLGEFSGYYGSPRSRQPVIEVKAVHMRRAPIITAALMARYPSCEQGAYYAMARSARVLDNLDRLGVPGIRGVYLHPAAASAFGMLVVSLQQKYAGHVAQVLALCAQAPAAAYFTKWIIAVDDDVDPTDLNQVLWALSTRCNPSGDIDILHKTLSSGLDPSQFPADIRPYGSKALIDACKPHKHLKEFPKSTMLRRGTYESLRARWDEFGFSYAAPNLTSFHED